MQANEPSEEQLRRMLDERDREMELGRRRQSRKLTGILCLAAVVVTGSVLCFPATRKMIGGASHDSPEVMAVKAALKPDGSGIPDELKPFSIKPESNARHEDVRFAMELLQFVQPPAAPRSKAP